jgi:hypothetical protein
MDIALFARAFNPSTFFGCLSIPAEYQSVVKVQVEKRSGTMKHRALPLAYGC